MEGLGVSACSKGPHDFIHPWLKGGDCQRLFEVWQYRSSLAHGQNALLITPPSTRSAAPVVAEASGLAT
jgi:hypothetical protein